MRVIVLGGGLSGLSAALELVRRGCSVRLVEAAPFLGGRTSSFVRDGMNLDTGLHVVASHYLNLLDLLDSVGAADRLAWWDEHLVTGRP